MEALEDAEDALRVFLLETDAVVYKVRDIGAGEKTAEIYVALIAITKYEIKNMKWLTNY